jgi:hypothetical protein
MLPRFLVQVFRVRGLELEILSSGMTYLDVTVFHYYYEVDRAAFDH